MNMIPVDMRKKDIKIERNLVSIEKLMVFQDIDTKFSYTGTSIKYDETITKNIPFDRNT
jgi:hypothetical protein